MIIMPEVCSAGNLSYFLSNKEVVMKKIYSILLSTMLAVSMLWVPVFAEETTEIPDDSALPETIQQDGAEEQVEPVESVEPDQVPEEEESEAAEEPSEEPAEELIEAAPEAPLQKAAKSGDDGSTQDDSELIGGGTVLESSTSEWKYIYNDLGAALIAYLGSSTSITIPKTIGGHNVIALKKDLLKDQRDTITSVKIEAELTSLPDGFFGYCWKLTSVILPDSITEIGSSAFSGCSALPRITLPETLTGIGDSAFSNCTALKSVTIPDGVTKIASRTFNSCTSLEEVELPGSLTEIGSDAFGYCSALESIQLPDSIEKMGWYAFERCTKLRTVRLPESLSTIEMDAFIGCTSLKDVYIPEGVTEIEGSAFQDCTSLSKVHLPATVTTIGGSAFKDCTSLIAISVPASVTSIGTDAFSGDSLLTIYGTAGSAAETYAGNNDIDFSTEEMPEGEAETGTYGGWTYVSYGNKTILTGYTGTAANITIPAAVSGHAVSGLQKDLLTDHRDTITSVKIEAELTSLPDGFFRYCWKLTSVILPDSITEIGSSAFSGCSALPRITLPETLTGIGDSAFSNCTALKSVTIPDGVTKIASRTFNSCTSLEEVELPGSLTEIGSDAFGYCSALESIQLPDSIEKMGWYAFERCTKLRTVRLPESLSTIEMDAFIGCTSLKDVYIPEGVTEIEGSAFQDCTSLSKVHLPATVTTIGASAFQDCIKLSGVSIYENVSEIGTDAFKGDPFLVLSCINNNMAIEYAQKNGLLYSKVMWDTTEDGSIATISGDTVPNLSNEFTIFTVDATAEFDSKAVAAIKSSANGQDINLEYNNLTDANTGTAEQKEVVSTFLENEGKAVELKLTDSSGNDVLFGQNGGTIKFTVSYTSPAGVEPYVFCVDAAGDIEDIPSSYDRNNNSITFETKHFSIFTIGSVSLVEKKVRAEDIGDQHYTGEAVEPDVDVYNHFDRLKNGTDYSIDYADNIEAGTATATITFIGGFEGQDPITKEFRIIKCLNGHTFADEWTVDEPATLSADGVKSHHCTVCEEAKSDETAIAHPTTFKLAAASYTYTGKAIMPAVTAIDANGQKIDASNYTVKYSNNTVVGKATAAITFKGNYSGTKNLTFTINPKGTALSKVTAAKKGFTVKWKKQAVQTTGYQIQYGLKSNFKGAKTVTIKKNKTVKGTVKKLKAKKKYYVRIRTYRTVGGKTYYSAWSASKAVKTK